MSRVLRKRIIFALKDLSFKYPLQKNYLFEKLNLAIEYGESVAILCPEGQGRTTLFKLFLGMEDPTEGRVFINEFPAEKLPNYILNDYRAQVGFIFANGALINNLTIFDNIALPLRYHGNMDEQSVLDRVENVLERFSIKEYEKQRPAFVSAYVRKIAGIARAFIMTPPVFLLDDIFTGLNRKQIIQLTLNIKETLSISEGTHIYASNDPEMLQHFADRVLLIKEGRLIFDGGFPEFFNSQDTAVQSYLKNTMVRTA